MKRSKAFILALVVLLPFATGCASSGVKKPTLFVDQYNNIPADIPSQFLNRYDHFIPTKEFKEFKKLLTDEERQAFIDKFWEERDTDPATSWNEYKQEIDDRIDDIVSERFFNTAGMTGLLFRSNGGFRGDMAQVYLLYGEPDIMDMLEGRSFSNLMLWVYVNPENGNILYAFLFYQKGSLGVYNLFPQDSYKMDMCSALYEVATLRSYSYPAGGMERCSEDLYRVYEEIYRSIGKGGILDGDIFVWSLFNFSQEGSLLQGKALEPPKPASEIAKQSKARVTGEAPKLSGTAETDYILASCEKCNSLIPAELQLGKEFTLLIRRSDIDWKIVGEQAEVELKVRIMLENAEGRAPLIFEKEAPFKDNKNVVVSDPQGQVVIVLLTADEVAEIPAGTYQVSVYVKNIMTNKYNAWSKEFTK